MFKMKDISGGPSAARFRYAQYLSSPDIARDSTGRWYVVWSDEKLDGTDERLIVSRSNTDDVSGAWTDFVIGEIPVGDSLAKRDSTINVDSADSIYLTFVHQTGGSNDWQISVVKYNNNMVMQAMATFTLSYPGAVANPLCHTALDPTDRLHIVYRVGPTCTSEATTNAWKHRMYDGIWSLSHVVFPTVATTGSGTYPRLITITPQSIFFFHEPLSHNLMVTQSDDWGATWTDSVLYPKQVDYHGSYAYNCVVDNLGNIYALFFQIKTIVPTNYYFSIKRKLVGQPWEAEKIIYSVSQAEYDNMWTPYIHINQAGTLFIAVLDIYGGGVGIENWSVDYYTVNGSYDSVPWVKSAVTTVSVASWGWFWDIPLCWRPLPTNFVRLPGTLFAGAGQMDDNVGMTNYNNVIFFEAGSPASALPTVQTNPAVVAT